MDRRIEQVSLGRAIIEIAQWRLNIHIENWVQYVAVTWVYPGYMYMYTENPSCPVDPWIVLTCIVVFGCLSYSESTRLVTYSVCLSFLCNILRHSKTIPGSVCLSIPCTKVTWTLPNYPWMSTLPLTHSVSEYTVCTCVSNLPRTLCVWLFYSHLDTPRLSLDVQLATMHCEYIQE